MFFEKIFSATRAKGTFALLPPVCSIPAGVFLSCGTSPYYNRSLYRRGGRKPGLRTYHHHNRQRQSLWRLVCEHLNGYGSHVLIIRNSKIIPSFFTIKEGIFYLSVSPARRAPPLSPSPFPLRGQGM